MSVFVQTARQGSAEQLQRYLSQLRDIEHLLIRLAGPRKGEPLPEVQEVLSEVRDEIARILAQQAARQQASSFPS